MGVDGLDTFEHKIECDGGPHCQAEKHIHGCFAENPRHAQRSASPVPPPTRGAVDPELIVDTVADAIWPLAGLSSDEARDELRRDVRRGLEAAGLLDHPRGAVCVCGNGEAEDDRGAVLRCPVHGPGAV